MGSAASPRQAAFRFYNDDGSESGSTATAAQDVNITITEGGGNCSFQLRIGIQNDNANPQPLTHQLQYSKNGGIYTDVTTTSSNVKAFNSANLTNDATTTQRLTGLTGSFTGNGGVSEDGLTSSVSLPASGCKELLYAIQTVDADLANGDTLDLRVLANGSTLSGGYTVTPRITNQSAGAGFAYSFGMII